MQALRKSEIPPVAPVDSPCPITDSNRFDAEVQANEREDEALEILHEIVEYPQSLRVLTLLDVQQRANLGRRKRNVLVAHDHL